VSPPRRVALTPFRPQGAIMHPWMQFSDPFSSAPPAT
jgi:hypothetical protein